MEWTPRPLRHFLDAQFRFNSAFELVPLDLLSPREREMLSSLHSVPDFFAILRPVQPGLALKSACRDTALLLNKLQVPGPIPRDIRQLLGMRCGATIAKLVLDRVLEIEGGSGFVSGFSAQSVLFEDVGQAGARPLSPVTIAALRYAQALKLSDTIALSARLYTYNRLPVSPAWRKRLPSEAAVLSLLEIEPGGRNQKILQRSWSYYPSKPNQPGWLFWQSASKHKIGEPRQAYKLYVSPMVQGLPEAFHAILERATETGARALKVGKDIYGLLRPDKLVIYYSSWQEIEHAAQRMKPFLCGLPGHTVPFTAALDSEGLLSWGMDPPRREQLVPWQGPSWRSWLTDRLAMALISGNGESLGSLEPWQLALDRISLENIDVTTWAPSADLWDTSSGNN
ncbi:MAG TPA: hypothetical protein VIT23_04710 [Terrimicrobiaceae bacterium]